MKISEFDGEGCELLKCSNRPVEYFDILHLYTPSELDIPPNVTCGGVGQCLTMNQLSDLSLQPFRDDTISSASYSSSWDANSIQTCHCTRYSSLNNHNFEDGDSQSAPFSWAIGDFMGYSCDEKLCPFGDDPTTYGINEEQHFYCEATDGTLEITFRLNSTTLIAFDASTSDLKSALEKTGSLRNVTISFSSGSSLCTSTASTNLVTIEFNSENGDVPLISINSTFLTTPSGNSPITSLEESKKGTTENIECSGKGVCDRNLGKCNCITGFFYIFHISHCNIF